jgi:hypothetical protein
VFGLYEELLIALIQFQIGATVRHVPASLVDVIALAPVNLAQQALEFLPTQTPDRIYPGLRVEPISIRSTLVPPRPGSSQAIQKNCSTE